MKNLRASFQVPLSLAIGTPDTSKAIRSTIESVIQTADPLGTVTTPTLIEFAGKERFVTNVNPHPSGGYIVKTFDGLNVKAEGPNEVLTLPQ